LKRIKNVSIFFGLLDLLSLILISHQEYAILANYRLIPEDALSQTKVVLLLITYPLLFFVSGAIVDLDILFRLSFVLERLHDGPIVV
jgi:hypothetical protein